MVIVIEVTSTPKYQMLDRGLQDQGFTGSGEEGRILNGNLMGTSQGSIFSAQSMFKQNNGGANLSTKLAVSVSILILGDILLPTAILRNKPSWSTRQWPSLGLLRRKRPVRINWISSASCGTSHPPAGKQSGHGRWLHLFLDRTDDFFGVW